ncbi:MAG: hypothetical protein RL220_1682 [Bacteroidota bacterium]|jgi:sugar transferase (PEP-CTERM/EpsH1 system associated)
MKLLVLTPRVPWPLEKGDKLRAWHQIRILSRSNKVCLCCLSDGPVDPRAVEHLSEVVDELHIIELNRFSIGLNLLFAAFSSRPYQVHYFYQSGAARRIRNIVKDFKPDHIYCQLIRASEYVKHIHHISKTLDYMDAFNAGHSRRLEHAVWYMKPLLREEAKRLARYENLIFDYFDHHTIISAQDRELIFHPRRNSIDVVPNGVDTEYFSRPAAQEFHPVMLFTGNMGYPPNVDCAVFLAKDVMPLIWEKYPDVKLVIAGANPAASVERVSSEKVEVTGWVEDIRACYHHAGIFLAPMRIGTGLQNKILEAMSCGVPCITSSLAAGALGVEQGKECLIADDAKQVADCAIKLLESPDLRNSLSQNAHEMVRSRYSWESSVQILEEIFARSTAR